MITDWNIEKILPLIWQAGALALEKWQKNELETEFKADHTPVTQIDRQIEAMFAEAFDHPQEGSFLIGEETCNTHNEDYLNNALSGNTWVVDPIDGTSPFANRLPMWGISVGFMKKSAMTEGVILLPTLGELYITENNQVWTATNIDLKTEYHRSILKPFKHPATTDKAIALSQKITKFGNYRGLTRAYSFCSSVYSAACVLSGRTLAYTPSGSLWDIAAAIPLVQKAGGYIRWLDGRAFNSTVTNQTIHLEKHDPRRWKLRNHLFIAISETEGIKQLQNSIQFDGH